MEKDNVVKTAEGIGKEIISRLHKQNEESAMDDAEYIPLIKRIIEAVGIYICQNDNLKASADKLTGSLVDYAKELYVEVCQFHAEEGGEDITPEQVKVESEEYFDYIYEHEEHPH
jgi:hypothetical protein